MAVVVIISGFGALNGWAMIVAEMPLAAAKDGLFDARFKRLSKKGVPAFGIISGTVLPPIAMGVNYIGSGGATVFTTLILMADITVALPYGFSALAQIKWRIVDNRAVHTPRFVRDMLVAVLSLVFSILFIWYSRKHRASLLYVLGSVLPSRRRPPARHPRLLRPAREDDRTASGTGIPLQKLNGGGLSAWSRAARLRDRAVRRV